MKRPDKYKNVRYRLGQLFYESQQHYGYRRIYELLKRENITVSEKSNPSNQAGRRFCCQQQTAQEV